MNRSKPWLIFAVTIAFISSCAPLTASSTVQVLDDGVHNTKSNDNSKIQTRNLRSHHHYHHHHPQQSNSAIAVLTTNSDDDLDELCLALESLQYLNGDPYSPVLIFNEGNLQTQQMYILSQCTERTVAFPIVHLNDHFPPGFDPITEWDQFQSRFYFQPVDGREVWSYSQMIRFWTVGIWKHPAIQQFETIMRIDTDSCFLNNNNNHNHNHNRMGAIASGIRSPREILPKMEPPLVYQSIASPPSYNTFVHGLFEFAMEYLNQEQIEPSHPDMWNMAKTLWLEEQNVPLFKTNFEVSRVSFFTRPDVMKWHESLSEREPFGIWRYRWGDAHTRFLTMAMFGTTESVLILPEDNDFYDHGRGKCLKHNTIWG